MPRFRFTLKRMFVGVAIAAVLSAIAPFMWSIVTLDFVDDAYIQWGAGNLVVAYLKDHDDRWPRGWDDFAPQFEAAGGYYWGFPISEYRNRLRIDWSADVTALKRSARSSHRPDFQVITARNRTAGVMSGHEPNEILHAYLRGR